MNIKQKIAMGLFAFGFGASILAISLIKTSAVKALSEAEVESSRKQLYFNREMQPDHLLYPLKVAQEKLELLTLSPEERIEKKIEFSKQRFESAKNLLSEEEFELSLATFIKSQQYLFESADFLSEIDFSHPDRQLFIDTLTQHHQELEQIVGTFPNCFENQLRELLAQQQGVLDSFN